MTRWRKLPRGTRVQVIANVEELRRLCERCAPGARTAVKFNPQMGSWAGQICTVQRNGGSLTRGYTLSLEDSSGGREFQFPYDALLLEARLDRSNNSAGESENSESDADSYGS